MSRRQRGTAPNSTTELPHEVVFSRPAGSRPTHLHRAIPEVSHVYIHIYTMVTFRMSWHTLSCPRHCHPQGSAGSTNSGMAKGSPGQLRLLRSFKPLHSFNAVSQNVSGESGFCVKYPLPLPRNANHSRKGIGTRAPAQLVPPAASCDASRMHLAQPSDNINIPRGIL